MRRTHNSCDLARTSKKSGGQEFESLRARQSFARARWRIPICAGVLVPHGAIRFPLCGPMERGAEGRPFCCGGCVQFRSCFSKAQGCHLKVDRDAYRSPTGYGRTCCRWCGGHSVRPPFAGSPQVWRGLLVGEAARDRQDQLCHTECRVEPRAGVRSPAAPSPVDHRVHCLPQRPATIAVNLIRRQALPQSPPSCSEKGRVIQKRATEYHRGRPILPRRSVWEGDSPKRAW